MTDDPWQGELLYFVVDSIHPDSWVLKRKILFFL